MIIEKNHTVVRRPRQSTRLCSRYYNSGFTLLEMSIVLLIMGLLLGTVMQPMGAGMIERNRRETLNLLIEIREAIIGYAAVHHRLPCPIAPTVTPAGLTSQTAGSECLVAHGYVPAAALGISGHYDDSGFLTDSWGLPIHYHVTLSDADSDGLADFTTVGEMRDVGIQNLSPEFEVCNGAGCAQLRANRVPVVVLSTGQVQNLSADENENQDADSRFVSRDLDTVGADQFDDIVIWLSGNILFTRLLQAHVLP